MLEPKVYKQMDIIALFKSVKGDKVKHSLCIRKRILQFVAVYYGIAFLAGSFQAF